VSARPQRNAQSSPRRRPKRDGRDAVKRFFEELLPKAVVQSTEKFLAQDGSIAIAVQPHGRWTLRFGSLTDPVSEGFDHEADLRVWFGPGAFARFVEGTLDVEEAVSARQIKLLGDTKLMERLGFLMEVGGSPLQTMLALRGG
jgi:hypothetical protein